MRHMLCLSARRDRHTRLFLARHNVEEKVRGKEREEVCVSATTDEVRNHEMQALGVHDLPLGFLSKSCLL